MSISIITEFINQGLEIRKTEYHDPMTKNIAMIPYISGPKYDVWMNKIKIFATRNLTKYPLYDDIIETCKNKNHSWGTQHTMK